MEIADNNKSRGEALAQCPHLLDWTSWNTLFCRLRYKGPDILNSYELLKFCKNENHVHCKFFTGEICKEQEKKY